MPAFQSRKPRPNAFPLLVALDLVSKANSDLAPSQAGHIRRGQRRSWTDRNFWQFLTACYSIILTLYYTVLNSIYVSSSDWLHSQMPSDINIKLFSCTINIGTYCKRPSGNFIRYDKNHTRLGPHQAVKFGIVHRKKKPQNKRATLQRTS